MSPAGYGAVAAAVAAVATLIYGLVNVVRSPGRLRNSLKVDVDIYNGIPDCPARERLFLLIQDQIGQLVKAEYRERRDWSGIAMGAIGLVSITGLCAAFISTEKAWTRWLLLAPFGVLTAFFLFVLWVSIPKVQRDQNGLQVRTSNQHKGVTSHQPR